MQSQIKTIALSASLLFFTSLAIAGNTVTIEKANKENVRREIIRSITCPDFVTENSEANDVKALVAVDESGKVTLYEINSANPELKKYVVNTLKEMKLKSCTPTEKFVLVVKFRVA
ncbi:MAG TPA: hypothetical protein VK174_14385 [Chitinophagales bacterium]|nr:hypothetical protein [Chitinophagales bacterium]HLP50299.1 hypothetical protein [Chitinophagales bacterium]